MRIYHLADLHFGKSIYGYSMLDDQKDWVRKFLKLCKENRPEAVVIAGDVYDRSAPSGDAVSLLDHLLTQLAEMNISVFMIAGNHDSGQRLSFGRTILARQKIHIAGTVEKEISHVTLDDPDGYGPVTFWMCPYLFPEQVSELLKDDEIRTYDQAMRSLIGGQEIDLSQRNVMIAHQNVTANGKEVERGGSETMVGGVGQIDYTVFDAFDYTALGHIHSSYPIGRAEVRYAGTPLCYHFTETRQQNKGCLEIILGRKGEAPQITPVSIPPLHRMRALCDTKDAVYDLLKDDTGKKEYIGITITDQRITPEISSYLKQLLAKRGSILMELLSSYSSFSGNVSAMAQAVETRALEDLFSDLYTEQSGGTPPTDEEYALMQYVGELVRHQDAHEPMDPKDLDKILAKAGGKKA